MSPKFEILVISPPIRNYGDVFLRTIYSPGTEITEDHNFLPIGRSAVAEAMAWQATMAKTRYPQKGKMVGKHGWTKS